MATDQIAAMQAFILTPEQIAGWTELHRDYEGSLADSEFSMYNGLRGWLNNELSSSPSWVWRDGRWEVEVS